MGSFDPFELASVQLARDKRRTRHMPSLFDRKVTRMRASSVGFLRGAAPLFYELCAMNGYLREGPAGKGWITGDLHVENFGVYRTVPVDLLQSHPPANLVFDLNDFDDAVIAPWHLDVLRLLTSLVLAARELGANGSRSAALPEALLEAYVASAIEGAAPASLPEPVARLLERAKRRTRPALLDARTIKTPSGRRFLRDGVRYAELPAAVDRAARRAFRIYAGRVEEKYAISADHFEVVDTAFRIAGTGSLGTLRIAVLVRGKDREDGNWIFDMKAQSTPAVPRAKKTAMDPASRVLESMGRCLEYPPHMAGVADMGKSSMLVRRLAPQEDKLDLAQVPATDLEPLAQYLGALTGAAHRRGALSRSKRPRKWTSKERANLLSRTFALAGAHEAVYLAYARLTETLRSVRSMDGPLVQVKARAGIPSDT